MVDHLRDKVAYLIPDWSTRSEALVIDIGSNDGTLLSFYSCRRTDARRYRPTSHKFRAYYRRDIHVITIFFRPVPSDAPSVIAKPTS